MQPKPMAPALNTRSNAFTRIAAAGVLIPAVIGILLYAPTWMSQALICVSFCVMGWEWVKMTRMPLAGAYMGIMLSALGLTFFTQTLSPVIALGLCGVLMCVSTRNLIFSVGAIYLGGAFLSLLYMAHHPWIVMLMLVIVWSNDSFAYFIGKLIGGKKLCPAISPGKTWSGLIGGVVLGAITSWVFAQWVIIVYKERGLTPQASLLHAYPLLICCVLSITGHAGDLLESAAKRHFGVKDSGSVIPGHGGMLDRLDSLLAVCVMLQLLAIAIVL